MDQIECVVIGAGVVGLAVARALAARGREVIVLEAAEAIGVGTSSRNSEVIHAGIYYPRGSAKAALCVRGREMLYDYCVEHNVPHSRCGKLLVATSRNQIPQLESIMAKGRDNGVLDLMRISGEQAQELEPALQCVEAVFSPQTGIVDSHQLMLAIQGDAERDLRRRTLNRSGPYVEALLVTECPQSSPAGICVCAASDSATHGLRMNRCVRQRAVCSTR